MRMRTRIRSKCTKRQRKMNENHVWFFGEINRSTCKSLHLELFRLYEKQKQLEDGRITIHLQTEGGCVVCGFNVYDLLRSLKEVTIEVICEGEVTSAGTIMLLGATERKMRANSVLLIHEISGGCWGKFSHMKDEMCNLEMLSKRLTNLYKENTNITGRTLKGLLTKDIYFDATTSLKAGLINAII